MSSYFDDAIEFRKPVSFTGDAAAEQAIVRYVRKAFVLANIAAGTLAITNGTDIPANAIVLGAYIKTTTQPTFGGTTTGLTAKIGTAADDDGFGQAISIAGTAGLKIPEPGARRGALNSSQNIAVAFTATGGAASLAEVTAGAGLVFIAYALAPVS